MKCVTRKIFLSIVILHFFSGAYSASILLNTRDATVWLPQQTITGNASGLSSNKIKWHVNNTSGIAIVRTNGTFSFFITLTTTNNIIWVEDADLSVKSDTINYTLGYNPLPEVKPFATIDNNLAMLNVSIVNNPYNAELSYKWNVLKSPAFVTIHNSKNLKATAQIPTAIGDYFFTVTVYAGIDSVKYTTFVTRTDTGLRAFNIANDHAAWIDSALIYEVTPYVFVHDGQYPDITKKLPELKELGVNTIWLQPIYKTKYGEQGYDIIDYFSLRPDLGTEKDLKDLITTAKNLNMHVVFDFVPNHTSTFHPYAKEVQEYQTKSHYYNFYQHTDDGAKYSSQYQIDSNGFVHYFWDDLVNIDYNNAEVQQWMLEAFKYWLRKFDIDGYRIDAAWAFNARNPSFGRQLQTALKSIKPDILLLVEDKGAIKSVYKKGYDAAYDWTADSNWISSWSWATDYNPPYNPTVFNYYDEDYRSTLLNKSLFKNGDTEHLRLRFLENNDQQRFITAHGKERTKMASALMFALPGLPMLYNGQEIGFERKQYSNHAIFKPNQTIQSQDTNNLFPWYEKLLNLRIKHDALRSNHMQSLPVNLQTMYALHRWQNNENIIVLTNLGNEDATATVNISSIKKATNNAVAYTDLITNEIFYANKNLTSLKVLMKRYNTRLLLASQDDSTAIADEK
jgi:cyclomaltodextrinase